MKLRNASLRSAIQLMLKAMQVQCKRSISYPRAFHFIQTAFFYFSGTAVSPPFFYFITSPLLLQAFWNRYNIKNLKISNGNRKTVLLDYTQ